MSAVPESAVPESTVSESAVSGSSPYGVLPELRESDGIGIGTHAGHYGRLTQADQHAARNLKLYFESVTHVGHSDSTLADHAVKQSFLTALPLAAADVLVLYLSVFFTTGVLERIIGISTTQVENQTAFFISLVILPIAHLAGLYPGVGDNPIVEFRQVARALFAALAVLAGIGWFCFPEHSGFYCFAAIASFGLALPGTIVARFYARRFASQHFRWWGVPTLIVAEPGHAAGLYERLRDTPEQGFRPVGVLIDREQEPQFCRRMESCGIPVVDMKHAGKFALLRKVTYLIVSSCAGSRLTSDVDKQLASIPNRVILSSERIDLGIWDHVYSVGSRSGLRLAGTQPTSVELALKRLLDIVVSVAVLAIGSPIWLLICLSIRFSSAGPVFYGQKRIGFGGQEFTAWKFRSMVLNADAVLDRYLEENPEAKAEWNDTHKLKNDPRVTWIGRILRATSLDELPQLWNIAIGEMSLVGPRPLVDSPTYDEEYVHHYVQEFEAYKTVKPGLTGLWQVRCRNHGHYQMRMFYDMYYIRNWCIWLDLYLIMRTIRTVIYREGM